MELRWYWRVLKRQARVIWLTTLIVAVLSLLYTAYAAYGQHYKVTETIEFYANPPLIGGQTLNIDPQGYALGVAGGATGTAKFYTQQNEFFKRISAELKRQYGKTMDYKTIMGGLGANITGGRQFELEYKSSDNTLAERLVSIAVQLVEHDFLPTYNQTVVQPGKRPDITTFPVQVRLYDPLNSRTVSLSSTLIGWIVKVVVGLVLGVALAFLWEYLDESIHDEHDVRSWMGVPTLGVIPGGRARTA
jgi:hypothetical protein